jgi:hypothetical protein
MRAQLKSYSGLSTILGGLWKLIGLVTGKAAAWAVKKQKQHHVVSERAMVAMENVNTHT